MTAPDSPRPYARPSPEAKARQVDELAFLHHARLLRPAAPGAGGPEPPHTRVPREATGR